MQAFRPETLLKIGSNTGVFLWMLRMFKEQFFLQNTSGRLLSCLLEREEEESVEQRSEEKFFKWKKKMKTFHLTCKFWCLLKQKCKYYCVHIIEVLTLFYLLFLQIFFLLIPVCSFFVFSFRTNCKTSLVACISIIRSKHWVFSIKQLFY